MSAVPADLSISSRWILPMTSRDEVLENHTLVVLDGRIIDILPSTLAPLRYVAAAHLDRPGHLLMPGLVNAHTGIGAVPGSVGAGQIRDIALLRIAAMLQAGTTCFCATGYFPEESLHAAVEQGMRAVIGIPIAEAASYWAENPADYLTRALRIRDEFRAHPTITTAFAPQRVSSLSDATFARIATLADEVDAAIIMTLHESTSEIDGCVLQHGLRPLERLHAVGLLTPAFTGINMLHASVSDISLAQRSGIAIALCPEANLRAGHGAPPVAAWSASGLRLALGSDSEHSGPGADLWTQLKLLARLSAAPSGVPLNAWDALAIATRGGAAALGLAAEIGTLEIGKWADLCCVDLHQPALLLEPAHPVTQLAHDGARDLVSDVWVAGRHLVEHYKFTRLDWSALAARVLERRKRPQTGVVR